MQEAKRSLNVYMAASRDCAGEADEVAKKLREMGVTVVSRWHDGQTKLVDPHDPNVRNKILAENLKDLRECFAVVALMRGGAPKATYAEIGWALAEGRQILWVGPEDGAEDPLACIFDAHASVLRLSSLEQLYEFVKVYQWGPPMSAEQRKAELDENAPYELLLAKHVKRLVDSRAREINGMMGAYISADLTKVGMMMAEATKALVSTVRSEDPLRLWMTVAMDLLALATLGGNAALHDNQTNTSSREEMN